MNDYVGVAESLIADTQHVPLNLKSKLALFQSKLHLLILEHSNLNQFQVAMCLHLSSICYNLLLDAHTRLNTLEVSNLKESLKSSLEKQEKLFKIEKEVLTDKHEAEVKRYQYRLKSMQINFSLVEGQMQTAVKQLDEVH